MKVLIGSAEIAGWVHEYKLGFEELGHKVTTVITSPHPFYNHSYDYILNEHFFHLKPIKTTKKYKLLKRSVIKVKEKLSKYKLNKFIKTLIDSHDLLVYIWSSFTEEHIDLKYAQSKKKQIIHFFVGSDVRYFKSFQQQFDVTGWNFPNERENESLYQKISYIRFAEKYGNIIYSAPDQAGFQLKPYYHLQVPVNINKAKFINHQREIPIILHAPSAPFIKGTDIIEGTLKRLSDEKIPFELISIRNQPNEKVLELLSSADILVDELVFHGPGALSFEAMLSGCAVATRYLEDSPESFKPPIVAINRENIYEKLKYLITNYEYRNQLIEKGRKYAISHNNSKAVVENILKDLEFKRPFDYIPDFLRNSYIPTNKKETKIINKFDRFVEKCDWYKKFVLKDKSIF